MGASPDWNKRGWGGASGGCSDLSAEASAGHEDFVEDREASGYACPPVQSPLGRRAAPYQLRTKVRGYTAIQGVSGSGRKS